MKENDFWMVWVEGNRGPEHRHENEESAEREAERLARMNPDRMVHVLKRVNSCRIGTISWLHEPIPF